MRKMDLLLWIWICVLILCWCFLLGAVVAIAEDAGVFSDIVHIYDVIMERYAY